MTKLQHALSLSSSTYKNNVFKGFAQLQQNDEFVDMTLAADGHWVKVHRMLVALSSPYFKDLLQSLPCQHPVLYLNGVSNEALRYILEYIYTGEAEIPAGKVESFLNVARDLQIAGLKNITPPEEHEIASQSKDTEHVSQNSRIQNEDVIEDCYVLQPREIMDLPESRTENEVNDHSLFSIDVPMSSELTNGFQNVENMNGPGKAINITLNETAGHRKNAQNPVAKIEILSNIILNGNSGLTMTGQDQLPQSYTEALVNLNNQNMNNHAMPLDNRNISMDNSASISQLSNEDDDVRMSENIESKLYTVSNRGALQLIFNRFMYYCHYQRDNGRKRRWRCIDYRDAHCPAAIDTDGEQIVERKHIHCHPNHDEKIRKKLTKVNVKCFPTIELAQALVKQDGTDKGGAP